MDQKSQKPQKPPPPPGTHLGQSAAVDPQLITDGTAQIQALLEESISLKQRVCGDASLVAAIFQATELLATCARAGGTIYTCGNGGSACDSMHLCEELVARYKRNRPGIRAVHFMDPSTLSCWANDFDFAGAYARYAETFCTARDVLVAISTSGNSANIVQAAEAARARGTAVIGLTGKTGGALAALADVALIVPDAPTERTQEVHITVIHIWLELLETRFGFA